MKERVMIVYDDFATVEDKKMLLEYFLNGGNERELLDMVVSEEHIREVHQYYIAVYFD